MWDVDLGAARLAVLDHPWVRRASVDRVWPSTVRITIEERTPVALLNYGEMYYIDEQGVPFLLGMDKGDKHTTFSDKAWKTLPAYKDIKAIAIEKIKASF